MTLKKLLILFVLFTVSVKGQDKKEVLKRTSSDSLNIDTINNNQKEIQRLLKELNRPDES